MKQRMARPTMAPQMNFTKVIYDYENKREKDIQTVLQREGDLLKLLHPGYVFANIKAGVLAADGSCTYTLIFKLKK